MSQVGDLIASRTDAAARLEIEAIEALNIAERSNSDEIKRRLGSFVGKAVKNSIRNSDKALVSEIMDKDWIALRALALSDQHPTIPINDILAMAEREGQRDRIE